MTEQTGGCLCGDVRFRLVGAPYAVDYCHCHSCRKHTGAPVSAFADCKGGVVEFTKGAPTLYESSPGVRRGFCARCGSTLTYETDALPGEVHAPWIGLRTFRRTGSRRSPMSGCRGFGLRASIRCATRGARS